MNFNFAWLGAIALVITPCAVRGQVRAVEPQPAQVAPEQTPAGDDPVAGQELGERFCATGLQLARTTKYSAWGLRQSAVLLEAAAKLNPQEPRFLRMLAFWRTQMGDTDGAISAWNRYRLLVPDDRVAQSEVIDLYLGRLQSIDAKLKYIRNDLLPMATLDNTIKAHIATEAVSLLDQRSRVEALAMLAQARQFYPSPEVTLLELHMLPANATPVQRLAALLNVARANPSNDEAIGGVADLLSANGISDKALVWYAMLNDVHAIDDRANDETSMLNYLAERYRSGQAAKANETLDQILQRYPEDQHAWFLRLTMQKSQESPQVLEQARVMFAHRLSDLCDRIQKATIAGEAAPTSQPSGASVPDAIARVKKLDPKVEPVLIATLAEQAWFEIYYDHKADAALPAINFLKMLVPADSVAMRRLQGWYDLLTNDELGARSLLFPQKEQDALSALGLFELENQKNHPADATALGSKLLSFPQTGELAAVIYQATQAHGIKTAAATPDAAAMKTELEKFPADWLEVNRNPQRFYSLLAAPLAPAHSLGDPMLAEITLRNNSKLDITIGERGLIKPVYAFNADATAIQAEHFPGILVDRIMGRLVLHPDESISQIVRIDQGRLNRALYTLPAVRTAVTGTVVTNAPPENPGGRPQAGGYAKAFDKGGFIRNAMPLAMAPARQKIFAELGAGGMPRQKILDLDLLGVYYAQYVQPNANNAELAAAGEFLGAIDKARSDPDKSVKIWAHYSYALLSNGVEQTQDIEEMLQSPDWESRLLGLSAAQKSLPKDMARQLVTKAVSTESDPLVKVYGAGVLELLNQLAATQPAAIQPQSPSTGNPKPETRNSK